jgi:hypothetical protein
LTRPSDSYRAAAQYDYRLYGRNCCYLSTEQGLDISNARPATKNQVRCWMTTHSYRFKEKKLILPRRPR